MQKQNFFETLGVNRNSTQEEIRKAYLKKVKENRLGKDKNPALFEKIQKAFDVLSDPKKRSFYEKYGTDPDETNHDQNRGFEGGSIDIEELFKMQNFQTNRNFSNRSFTNQFQQNDSNDFEGFFSDFFGNFKTREKPTMKDVKLSFTLTLKEVLFGFKKDFSFEVRTDCKCKKRSFFFSFHCSHCENTGYVKKTQIVPLDIKESVLNQTVVLEEQGNEHLFSNEIFYSDVKISFNFENTQIIKNSFFSFEKNIITQKVSLSLSEAQNSKTEIILLNSEKIFLSAFKQNFKISPKEYKFNISMTNIPFKYNIIFSIK